MVKFEVIMVPDTSFRGYYRVHIYDGLHCSKFILSPEETNDLIKKLDDREKP